MKDVQTMLSVEEFVLSMGLYRRRRLAVTTDAPTKLRREGFARNMGRKGRLAAKMDAQIKFRTMDFVKDMVQK